jgi:hypothetical protein
MSKYDHVHKAIEAFKKLKVPDMDDKIEFSQFVLPAKGDVPCLVIYPYNYSGVHTHQVAKKAVKEIKCDADGCSKKATIHVCGKHVYEY